MQALKIASHQAIIGVCVCLVQSENLNTRLMYVAHFIHDSVEDREPGSQLTISIQVVEKQDECSESTTEFVCPYCFNTVPLLVVTRHTTGSLVILTQCQEILCSIASKQSEYVFVQIEINNKTIFKNENRFFFFVFDWKIFGAKHLILVTIR